MISNRSFSLFCKEYSDMISALDTAVEREKEYNKRHGVSNQIDLPLQTLRQDFKFWLKQLPVVCLNSSHYDLNLLQKHLIPILVDDNPKLSPIKKGNSFLSFATAELRFLDFQNYSLPLFLSFQGKG